MELFYSLRWSCCLNSSPHGWCLRSLLRQIVFLWWMNWVVIDCPSIYKAFDITKVMLLSSEISLCLQSSLPILACHWCYCICLFDLILLASAFVACINSSLTWEDWCPNWSTFVLNRFPCHTAVKSSCCVHLLSYWYRYHVRYQVH